MQLFAGVSVDSEIPDEHTVGEYREWDARKDGARWPMPGEQRAISNTFRGSQLLIFSTKRKIVFTHGILKTSTDIFFQPIGAFN